MLQTALALLIVLAATGYALWRLAPATWRRHLATWSGPAARATGLPAPLARRIEIKVANAAAQAGGCGSCGPCKGCGASAKTNIPN